jgi:hypothetical protein
VAQETPFTNRNSNGNLYVRYLYWNDGAWNWNNNWLDNDWNGNNPSAVLATFSSSLLAIGESFVSEAGRANRRASYLAHQSWLIG